MVEFALLAPIMIFLLFAILDLSRVFTEMASVESAAREAADYGTSLGAEKWSDTGMLAGMEARACTAASNLPDFQWTDADSDGAYDMTETCTNPSFDWCMSSDSTPCDPDDPDKTYPVGDPALDPDFCNNPARAQPCRVTVKMSHVFYLFVPFQLDFFGVKLGLPVSLPFERDSTFAMTDIEVDEDPGP